MLDAMLEPVEFDLAGILQAPDDLVKSREDRIAFASAFDDLHATGSADAFEAMG